MGRVSVTLHDARGRVRARAGEALYEGELVDPPRAISIGQRVKLHLARLDVVPPDDPLSLSGRVVEVAHVAAGVKNTPLHGGLRFTVEVAEIARSGDIVLDVPSQKSSGVFRRPDPVIASLGELPVFDDIDSTDGDTVLTPPPFSIEEAQPRAFPHTTSEELMREPTGVIGTLRHVSMAEVVQGLELGRRTARIDIRAGDEGRRGTIFLKHGQIVSARFHVLNGDEAFFQLARLRSGTYRVRFDRVPDEINVTSPTAYLLLEAMRKMDEDARSAGLVAPVLPSMTGEFRVSPTGEFRVSPTGESRVSPVGESRVSPTGEFRVSPLNVTLPPPPVGETKNDMPPVANKQVARPAESRERVRRRAKDPTTTPSRGSGTFSGFFEEAKEEDGEDEPVNDAFAYEPSFVSLRLTLRGIGDSQKVNISDTDWNLLSSSDSSAPRGS